jgi:TolB-like protein/tetratricopeptide (TPR) repeat protein
VGVSHQLDGRVGKELTISPALLPAPIRVELERVLSSRTFRVASGQKNLLRFVVEEALADRGHLLKEYSIGVEVFHRGDSFDPRINAIVRLEARKLRSRLAKYYELEGTGDPIYIEIPKGAYVPVFRELKGSPPSHLSKADVDVAASRVRGSKSVEPSLELLVPPHAPEEFSIAVLPFINRGSDEESECFTDGLTDELTIALGRIPWLRLTARTSAFRFKGADIDIRRIGRYLNVRVVIEGSVRKYGRRLRIAVQANETKNGSRLWSESYDRELDDPLQVQHEVALMVMEALTYRVFPEAHSNVGTGFARDSTSVPKAYESLAAGRNFYNRHTPGDFETAIHYFERAIACDPYFARPYVELAKSFVMLPFVKAARISDLAFQIRLNASRAIQLDDSLGEAHAALAIPMIHEGDWEAAGRQFRKGIELTPGDASTLTWYGTYLLNIGRGEEAMMERQKALELEPGSPLMACYYAKTFYYLRRFDEAIEHQRRALALDPDLAMSHIVLGLASVHKGSYARGIAELERGRLLMKDAVHARAHVAYTHAAMGNRERATEVLNTFLHEFRSDSFPALAIAEVYIGLGDKDQAFEWLHRAIDQKDWVVFLKCDPLFDRLRPDPRFATLLRRANLK